MRQPITDPPALARQLWRFARRQGWTRGTLRLVVGWHAPSEQVASQLRRNAIAARDYLPAPDEDYEPEDDPLDVVCVRLFERLTLSELEAELSCAARLGKSLGAPLTHAGLGVGPS